MIHTLEKRIECLILMEMYGFTYTELSNMRPCERDYMIEAHNALMEYKAAAYKMEEQTEEHTCDCDGECLDCACGDGGCQHGECEDCNCKE